jgi:hypothetical protein
MNNIFKEFNKNFFTPHTSLGIKWFDKEGLTTLDDNRVVSIKIDDLGTRDHYSGYWVEIIDKHQGTINKKFFRFRDHLEFKHRNENTMYYHVWYSDGGKSFEWYISKPLSTKPMVDTITDFINYFK